MLALDLMAQGEELISTKVTKAHLANIIKVLCFKLKWNEDPMDIEEKSSIESTEEKNSIETNDDKEIHSNAQNEVKNSEKICKFYRVGKCQHGKTGKKPNSAGKTCEYSHPPTCKKFELFGYQEKGCKAKNCGKLHLSLCKKFMKFQTCKFAEKCRYYHPKGLKSHIKDKHLEQKVLEKRDTEDTYANIVKKSVQQQVQSNGAFLGLPQPVHHIGQAHQVQQPFIVGQTNHTQQAFLEIQKSQKQMMDLFMNLNQKVMNMYNSQILA